MSDVTVTMSRVVCHAAIKHLRYRRDRIAEDRELLHRKHETIGDGHTNDAIVVLDGEIYLIEEAIAAMWRAYNDGKPL